YQFLTGERPFAGSATTTMQKVLKEDPLPSSSLNVQAPAGMDAVVRKALAKRPEDRFQTAREFADAMRAAAPGAPSAATDPTLVGAADATVLAAPAVAPALASASPSRSAEAAPAAAAVVAAPERKSQTAAVALAIGVAVVAYLVQRPSAAPAATTQARSAPAAVQAAPAASAPAAPATIAAAAPGTMLISAVGLIDPSDPR